MSRTGRAVEAWSRSYDEALAVTRNQVVQVEKEDHEWPGWFWCVDDAGTGGWLPRQCLDAPRGEARILEDFDTVELTVTPGEVLTLLQCREGWTWCRKDTGAEGWLPDRILEPA